MNNGRQEQTERVQGHKRSHVDEHASVRLPVLDGSPEVLHLEGFVLSRALLVLLETPQHTHAILRRQKLGLIGEVVHEEEGEEADENGQCTLDDEDPGPSSDASLAVQLLNGSCKETSKGTSQSGGGEEDGSADTEFVSLIPAREVVVDTGEQAGLGGAEEPSRGHETRPVLDKAHSKHACAPNDAVFLIIRLLNKFEKHGTWRMYMATYMMTGIKMEGRDLLSKKLARASKMA